MERLRRIASRAQIGCEEAEVGIDARGDRMIIAGAEMAIGAITLPFAAHDHRNLGVRLPLDEAVDDLHPGAFELVRPEKILLLVEARLQFDDGGHRFARLGRLDQRADDRRLVAGAIERLLDRDDVGIGRRLPKKRSEEHTSELQSLVRTSYAVLCMNTKTHN